MDIRTRFVFTLVTVSLASMLLLGVVTYRSVQRELLDQTFGQLDGLAEFKDAAVRSLVVGWHDRVGLVASRTQLRASLAANNANRSPASEARIERILTDAVGASPLFHRLAVTDPTGRVVAVAGEQAGSDGELVGGGAVGRAAGQTPAGRITRYEGVTFLADDLPVVRFSAALLLDGDTVGTLHATLGTEEIAALSANRVGMGETGETIVAVLDNGIPRALHPVRFSDSGAAGFTVASDSTVLRALAGEEARIDRDVFDYRHELVWAATRRVDETGWGLVVKIDSDEQRAPIDDFRGEITRVAVSLAAFAIFFGTLLGFRFARPILRLSDMAAQIGAGDLSARSGVEREDEIGLLARTFDGMAADLEEQVSLLTQFRRFFDVSIDLMCIASTDGYFKRVNPAFVRELGWSEEELLEKPFISLVHPDDVDATLREVERLAAGSLTIRFQNRFLRSDGEYLPLLWNSYPEEETGRLYAIARVQAPAPEAPR